MISVVIGIGVIALASCWYFTIGEHQEIDTNGSKGLEAGEQCMIAMAETGYLNI